MSKKNVGNSFGRRSGYDRRVISDSDYRDNEKRITTDQRKILDRRKHKRFQVKNPTYVKLRSETVEDVGQLLDISKGGISIRYNANGDKLRHFSELVIFSSSSIFSIDSIPFRTISDTDLTGESPFTPKNIKRYGLQFVNLTPSQTSKLDYFIRYYT